MRKLSVILILAALLSGCGTEQKSASYYRISQEEAWEMMKDPDVVILDVREQSEFDEKHITGAVLLPVGMIAKDTAAAVIPDFDTVVLVYCRSGNRSQTASSALAEIGYRCIYEFGGFNTWPYEVE